MLIQYKRAARMSFKVTMYTPYGIKVFVVVFCLNENGRRTVVVLNLAIGTPRPFAEKYFRKHGNDRVVTIVNLGHLVADGKGSH